MKRAAIAAFLVALAALPAAAEDAALDRLVGWMTGAFSSARQAAENDAFVAVHLHVVPIWRERTDARWLYVEQAVATALDRPYRQRVYRVSAAGDGSLRSEVFELPDPERYVGAWRETAPLVDLDPASLSRREGCAVVLWPEEDGRFRGSTVGRECTSTLRGAAYATSDVTVGPDALVSWDRGFDASGEQVWGSTDGPYVFERLPPERSPDR